MRNKMNFMTSFGKQLAKLSRNNSRAPECRVAGYPYFKFTRQGDAPPDYTKFYSIAIG
ncbi:hypothetical protein J40TS1_07470 [Paenibacillus montaniterrae]|uniref:Uncharacterized protein n=1 Tax=Paenibacillus montaniterrae TaxID=429341 RepID=A0A919YKG6_9BACL|nr:hypothetical protein J40TS1_07470 [Paenibacillus montaniterrae]